MAKKLAMSVSGYAKIERGQRSLNLDKLSQIAKIFNIDMIELIATKDKSFFFSIGDNTNNHNYIGADEKLALENEKNLLLLSAKEELLKQKDNEIETLKQMIKLLQKQSSNS